MTSQIVQSTAKQLVSPGGSVTFSLTGVAAGNALVITLQYGGSSSNIAGATYPTGWTAQSVKASSGGGRADVAFITNVAGGTESVTVSAAAGTYFTGEMHEVAGLAASPLDLVLTVTGGGTTLTPTAANHTTAQASEIIFSVVGYDPYNTGGTLGSTPPTGYTSLWQETDGNANAAGAGAYKVLSAITTVADTWTGLTATYNYAISVSLKLGGSAPTSATTTESASGADASSVTVITSATQAENASASDLETTGNAEAASLAEAGSAADIAATLILAISQIAESATAAVVAAAQSNTVAVLQEPASASDAQAASQAGVSSVAEQGAAADAPASAEQVGASTAEAGSAGDQPSSGNVLPAASAESGAAADSLSATVAFLSAAQEIASATDALAYAASTITDAAEAAHAADLVATLAQLSQSITEAALAQDTTSLIQTLAEIAEWQYVATQAARSWAVSMPGRSFYAGAAFRSFYILATSNMAMQFPSAIDPGDVKVLTLDATADLPAGVTLTGAPTVEVVVTRGTDANAGAHFTQPTINTTPVTVTTPTGTTTIAVGLCVQLVAAGCLDGCWYEIRVTCQTTQANNIEVLKGVLTCTAS